MRKVRMVILAIFAIICFVAAYRFASHGIPAHDNKCIALACLAVAVGGASLWFAFLAGRRRGRISN